MKQFSKFKQFADKAFVRPDRTEVLSEDLLEAERHIELIKQTVEVTSKKMAGCIQGQAKESTPIEKRIKKVPEYVLGHSLAECGSKLGRESILGEVLEEVGKIEMRVGQEVPGYEAKTESVLASLQSLLDTDFPAIYKLKRQLAKCTETMDTARGKLSQASRHSSATPTSAGAKVEVCRDELEESQNKVEQCRDNLSSEMYQLLNRESDIAASIVQFLKHQQEYHSNVSSILAELLPEVDNLLLNTSHKPAFGTDLNEHLNSSGRTIAYPLELCICALLQIGMQEEGLLRIAGGASRVKKLKSAFNARLIDLESLLFEFPDPHVISTCLKCYLRELPSPLLTTELYADWMNAIRQQDPEEKLRALWNVVQSLPESNRANLKYLVKFLKKLSEGQSVNKMSGSNIAIVIGPNLLWAPTDSDDDAAAGFGLASTQWSSSIIETLINYDQWFWPGDFDFYVTCVRPVETAEPLRSNPSTRNPSLTNGGDSRNPGHGTSDMKRTQSNSSLDDASPPQSSSSPKPILRRKTKPPPPAPPTAPTSQPVKPETAVDTRRDCVWIPPASPNPNMNPGNRRSMIVGSQSGSAPPAKVPPPVKPPQPQFVKDAEAQPLRKFDTVRNLTSTTSAEAVPDSASASKDVPKPSYQKVPPPPSATPAMNPMKDSPFGATIHTPKETGPVAPVKVPSDAPPPLRSKSSFRQVSPENEGSGGPLKYSTSSLPRHHHNSRPAPTLSTFSKPEVATNKMATSEAAAPSTMSTFSKPEPVVPPVKSTDPVETENGKSKSKDSEVKRPSSGSGDTDGRRSSVSSEDLLTPAPIGFEGLMRDKPVIRPVPAPRSSLLDAAQKPSLKAKPRSTLSSGGGTGGDAGKPGDAVRTPSLSEDEEGKPAPRLPYRPPRPNPPPGASNAPGNKSHTESHDGGTGSVVEPLNSTDL